LLKPPRWPLNVGKKILMAMIFTTLLCNWSFSMYKVQFKSHGALVHEPLICVYWFGTSNKIHPTSALHAGWVGNLGGFDTVLSRINPVSCTCPPTSEGGDLRGKLPLWSLHCQNMTLFGTTIVCPGDRPVSFRSDTSCVREIESFDKERQ
jgi:hypothetical protein